MKHIIKNDNTEAALLVDLLVWTDGVALFPSSRKKSKGTLCLGKVLPDAGCFVKGLHLRSNK